MTATRINPQPERQETTQGGWTFVGNGASAMVQTPQVTVTGYNTVAAPISIPAGWRPPVMLSVPMVTQYAPAATQKAFLVITAAGSVYVQGWGGPGGTVIGQASWTV